MNDNKSTVMNNAAVQQLRKVCLLYTSPSPRDS